MWKGKNMAEKMRYNKIIDLLEHGKPVFSTSTVPNGSLDDLTYIADADHDDQDHRRLHAGPTANPPRSGRNCARDHLLKVSLQRRDAHVGLFVSARVAYWRSTRKCWKGEIGSPATPPSEASASGI